MKVVLILTAGIAIAALLSGCGQDRSKLAQQTVHTYWYDVGHMKLGQAYKLLTAGNQESTTLSDYSQGIVGFLKNSAGISATVGTPKVDGDSARVPVTLHSPMTTATRKACQHLYWQNGGWRIADQSGGLSPPEQCQG